MKVLRLKPVSVGLIGGSPKDRQQFDHALRDQFDGYGFALLTDLPTKLHEAREVINREAFPYLRDDEKWHEIMRTWSRLKHGQLGPTGEGEEVHLDKQTRQPRKDREIKRYVSVDAEGNGWGMDDKIRSAIQVLVSQRFLICRELLLSYERARGLPEGTISHLISIDTDTHTTSRIQWYPAGGRSLDHTDKCAITEIDHQEGLLVESPKGSGNYLVLEVANIGDEAVNIGDTTARIAFGQEDGAYALSTRHCAVTPDHVGDEGRGVTPTFFHTSRDACFPDGENIWQWCVDEWGLEGAAADRIVGGTS